MWWQRYVFRRSQRENRKIAEGCGRHRKEPVLDLGLHAIEDDVMWHWDSLVFFSFPYTSRVFRSIALTVLILYSYSRNGLLYAYCRMT